MTEQAQDYWDGQAAAFDDEVDHGLRTPAARAAWTELLSSLLPPPPASVVDLGCGTGTLSVLLADGGYSVRGVDLSPRMVEAAELKARAAGVSVEFIQADAAHPPYQPASADVVLARHVLWALPDPAVVLSRWVRLLKPTGRLVLVEGHWSTGAGLSAADCEALVLLHRREAVVRCLDQQTALWGEPVDDERYVLLSLR